MKKEFYVQVDENKKWSSGKYRKVTREELDEILDTFGKEVLKLCSNGNQGCMAMWACFKNRINGGCYGDMINAYSLLSDDSKSLVDREHELRHALNHYHELWKIRYYGTVEEYYFARAKEAKEKYEKYCSLDIED